MASTWLLKDANRDNFEDIIKTQIYNIANVIISAAIEAIPKTSGCNKRTNHPLLQVDECKKSLPERREALLHLRP